MTDVNEPTKTNTQQTPSRIPEHLRNRNAALKVDASSAKIVAVGVSVAAGIGLIGVMASTPSHVTTTQPTNRIIVIQQPLAIATPAPEPLPISVRGATVQQPPVNTTLLPAPSVTVIEQSPPAQEQAPEPVTQTQGS